jgi:hypothetical protein
MRLLLAFALLFLIFSHGTDSKSLGLTEMEPESLPFHLEFPNPINEIEIFFDCKDNKFISREMICDGQKDCKSGADEEYCNEEIELN